MNKKIPNTVTHMEMADGTTVKMTLAYKYLLPLRSENKALYDRYNKVAEKGTKEEIDNVTVLYAGYVCGCIEDGTLESAMSEREFIEIIPYDREVTQMAVLELLYPKKAAAFARRLKEVEAGESNQE